MVDNVSSSCRDVERAKLLKILDYKFPHSFRKVGLITAGVMLLAMVIFKFSGYSPDVNKDVVRTLMLLALLIASLSSERFEDEYISHIRGQSYVVASVCAVSYSIILPLIAFALDTLIVGISGSGETTFHEVSAFEVLFMMICFQIMFFEMLKRLDRAE